MHPLQKRFQDFLSEHHLINKDDHVLLAVSGGLDSMVMLDLFHHSGLRIAVAHCNFGLRGEESDGDEDFVISRTQEKDIDCYVKRIELGEGSIQIKAREERYKWFDELCEQHGYTKIATAHHLDDSMETTLLNLIRGTGMVGLKGISLQRKHIVRPLLFASKAELIKYANETELDWREDSSNQKTEYDRNKIRHEIIPVLKELNPSLLQTYKFSKERIESALSILDKRISEIKRDYFNEEQLELNLDWVKSHEDLVILAELLSGFGFNYATSREVFAAIGHSGKRFPSHEYVLIMDRSSLFLKKNEEPDHSLTEISDVGVFQLGSSTFKVNRSVPDAETLEQGTDVALLDASKTKFPLIVRHWKQGDHFQPLGMKGTKKVSDFLVDKKIPLAKKDEVMVIESAGQIVWVVGHRISEAFKVTGATREILKIEKSGMS